MLDLYADIIVDISHENLDKTYQYYIPNELRSKAVVGALVKVPFGKGNRLIKGYIINISDKTNWDKGALKNISEIVDDGLVIESQLISLAYWIKTSFGSTMNDALKTVIPVKHSVKAKEKKSICLNIDKEEALLFYEECIRKNNKGRQRLLKELIEVNIIDYDIVINKLNISRTTIKDLEKLGIITTQVERLYRNPIKAKDVKAKEMVLTKEQDAIVQSVICDYKNGMRDTYLIHGVTGSGKTEVYIEIIDYVIKEGKQVIMLIPEIALTYQTVMRFYRRFGDRISILNSRMSSGERYDQYERAKKGDIDIMIGPRSALFTPFKNLGLIIIDEEHEGSYKSENPPKYHAREVAIKRAELTNSSVILGSATPSLEAYKCAMEGKYKLFTLENRVGSSKLPTIHIVDLREELKKKNKSIFSSKLKEEMELRLLRKEQIMLFINRRGYAGFVSCRSCGFVMKCAHCDISLTAHNNGTLVCHYCGYNVATPKQCPSCNSKYIAAFGTGTQKVEEMVKKEFPGARVLRMDTDTTKGKEGHEKILALFSNHEADILVGTQMIVKGHDFPRVTLVGILAADLSLYASDYRAAERTYQLLAQASGRAGRGDIEGEVIIQTYQPEHYSIVTASKDDYKGFYEKEIGYRGLLKYPPVSNILCILIASKDGDKGEFAAKLLSGASKEWLQKEGSNETSIIGPSEASISKANDIYRYIIYIKEEDYKVLIGLKNYLEGYINFSEHFKQCVVQFDFNPMSGY